MSDLIHAEKSRANDGTYICRAIWCDSRDVAVNVTCLAYVVKQTVAKILSANAPIPCTVGSRYKSIAADLVFDLRRLNISTQSYEAVNSET